MRKTFVLGGFVVVTLLSLLVLSVPAQGSYYYNSCSTPYYSSSCYSAPTYYSTPTYASYPASYSSYVKVHEVVVPVLTPLPFFIDPRISYIHNGGNFVGVPLVQAAAPTAAAAPAPARPASTTEAPARDSLDDLIDRIEKRVKERTRETPVYEPDGPPPVPGYRKTTASVRPGLSAAAILKPSCYGCHSGTNPKGDFRIFSGPNQLASDLDREAVIDAITDDRMPPKESRKPRLTPARLAELKRQWGF